MSLVVYLFYRNFFDQLDQQVFRNIFNFISSRSEVFCSIQAFFMSNNFISTARLKLAINQANAKQRPETKLLLFENYSHSSTCYHPNKGHILNRSSRQRCSVKEVVLRNFAKFTGKHLCQSFFFNKHAGLRPATLLKERLWRTCFPVSFAKFL